MEKNIIVSVVIPCFNIEEYVDKCVKSIFAYGEEGIEVIMINDASSDDTYKVCRMLECQYENVTLINHEYNQGVESSRNEGLENVRGEWVLFVDGDDCINTSEIWRALKYCDKCIDILLFRFEYLDKNISFEEMCELKDTCIYQSKDIAKGIGNELSWEMLSCIGNKIYRRSLLAKNELKFETIYKFNEDAAFAIRALMNSKKVLYSNRIIYKYRQRLGSSMNKYRKNSVFSLLTVDSLLKMYFAKSECRKEKAYYLSKKRLSTIINALNNELIYGTRRNAYAIVERLVEDEQVLDELKTVSYGNEYTVTEKIYASAIINGEIEQVFDSAKVQSKDMLLKNWINKKIHGENLILKIRKYGTKGISIYGAGEIGRLLAAELDRDSVEVDYFIDFFYKGKVNGYIPCISVNEDFSKANIIISTVLLFSEDIINFLRKKTGAKLITIWDLLI